MDKQLLDKDSSSISQSLFQVLAVIKNNDFVRTDGAAMALTSSIIWSLLGHFFSQKQDNSDHQTQENDLQESAVNYRFNFSTTKLRTTEQQSMSVSMSDACSEEWDPVAFSSFMQSIPFFTLFTICANSYQSRLLGFASMKGILEAKISELPSDSFSNTLHLIMFWILQIESSWREGAHLKEQLETCFSLLKHLLVYVIEAFSNGQVVHRPDELIKTVLSHPAISMFMSKWMYSSILRNCQDMGASDIKSVDLQCKKWKRKN